LASALTLLHLLTAGSGPFRKKYVNEMKSGCKGEADSTATRRDGRN